VLTIHRLLGGTLPPIIHSLQKDADHVAIDARAGSLDLKAATFARIEKWGYVAGCCTRL